MEDDVSTLWEKYKHLGKGQAEKMVFMEAQKLGYSPAKVMLELRKIQNPKIKYSEYNMNPAFTGCQRDADGNVVDPYTMKEIPEEFLVSYISASKRFCFDLRSVAEAVYNGDTKNPFNREELPDNIIEKAEEYISRMRRNVKVNSGHIEVVFDSVFNVLIKVLRVIDNNILDGLSKSNLYTDGKSLYNHDFTEQFTGDEILLYPFKDSVEQALCHKNLFEYCSKYRTNEICNTLFHELGFLLRVPPIFLNEDGQSYRLDPNDTIYTTIRKIYLWIGGLEMVKRYNLVLDDGTYLSGLTLNNLASSEIPSLEIRYVYHEDYDSVKDKLFDHAFMIDDEEFIRAMAINSNKRLNDGKYKDVIKDKNYTLQDLVDLTFDKQLRNMKIYTHGRYADFYRSLVNKCSTVDELLSILQTIEFDDYDFVRAINWRDIREKLGENGAIEYINKFSLLTQPQIKTLIEGGTLPKSDYVEHFILLFDDIEFFIRHLNVIPELLTKALSIRGGKIREYVLNTESPMKLYNILFTKHVLYADDIIDKLSPGDLRRIFTERKNERYLNLIIANPNFPQDILDDEQYYKDEKILSYMLENPNFRKFKQAVVYHINGSDIYYQMLDNLTTEELIELFHEAGEQPIFPDIIDRITDAELIQYKHELYLEPSLYWFEISALVPDKKVILAFFYVSGITKDQVVEYLTRVDNVYNYELIANYFQFTDEDVKIILENYNILHDVIKLGMYPVDMFQEALSKLDDDSLYYIWKDLTLMKYENRNVFDAIDYIYGML